MQHIPKSFELAGIKIEVENDKELVEHKGYIGEARYHDQKILLDMSVAPTDSTEQAFYHELVHWILYVMNEDEMRNNEKLVDVIGHLLYQAMKTRTF